MKKSWKKPQLTVLLRTRPEEAILGHSARTSPHQVVRIASITSVTRRSPEENAKASAGLLRTLDAGKAVVFKTAVLDHELQRSQ